MVEIMTIGDFVSLPIEQQEAIKKGIKAKDRLEQWLRELNKKPRPDPTLIKWKPCTVCDPYYRGYIQIRDRNNADIHPSQIDKCLKFHWFACSGYALQQDEYVDPRLRMIFDMGHAWHHTVQTYGQKGAWGPEYRDEVPFDPDTLGSNNVSAYPVAADFWMRGSVDAIIDRYIIPNIPNLGDVAVRLVHEYKTINKDGFDKLTRPKPDHRKQAVMYSAVFNIPLVVFMYFNKDTAGIADYPVTFDQGLWNEIQAKIRRVQFFTEMGQPPPWEETSAILRPGECGGCGYRKLCNPPTRPVRTGDENTIRRVQFFTEVVAESKPEQVKNA